jgi:hypothetical protein
MSYFNMLHQHGLFAQVPYDEFVELLEIKLKHLIEKQITHSTYNKTYDIEFDDSTIDSLKEEIDRIKGFKELLTS